MDRALENLLMSLKEDQFEASNESVDEEKSAVRGDGKATKILRNGKATEMGGINAELIK